MSIWDKVKLWFGVVENVEEIVEDVPGVDTGYRECVDGKACKDETCTHKDKHENNTGCVNVCFKNGKTCNSIFTRSSNR